MTLGPTRRCSGRFKGTHACRLRSSLHRNQPLPELAAQSLSTVEEVLGEIFVASRWIHPPQLTASVLFRRRSALRSPDAP